MKKLIIAALIIGWFAGIGWAVDGAPTTPHYGWYIKTGTFSPEKMDLAQSHGWQGTYTEISWRDIETSQGSYDWTTLDEQIQAAQSRGLQTIIHIHIFWYGTGLPYKSNAYLPNYILNDSAYGYCNGVGGPYIQGSGGQMTGVKWYGCWMRDRDGDGTLEQTFPVTWNSNVKARLKALYYALGNRYNSNAYVEGIDLGIESSIGNPYNWSPVPSPDT